MSSLNFVGNYKKTETTKKKNASQETKRHFEKIKIFLEGEMVLFVFLTKLREKFIIT